MERRHCRDYTRGVDGWRNEHPHDPSNPYQKHRRSSFEKSRSFGLRPSFEKSRSFGLNPYPSGSNLGRTRCSHDRSSRENDYDSGNRASFHSSADKLHKTASETSGTHLIIDTTIGNGLVRYSIDPLVKRAQATNLLQEQNLLNKMIQQQHEQIEQREIEKEKLEVEMKRNMYKGRALSFEEERKKAEIDEKKKQIEVIKLEMMKLEHRRNIETFKNKIIKLEDEYNKIENLQKKEADAIGNTSEFGESLLQQHKVLKKSKKIRDKKEKKQAHLQKKIETYVHKNTINCPNFLDRLKYERKIQKKSAKDMEKSLKDQSEALNKQRDNLEVKVNKLEEMMKRREMENAEFAQDRRKYSHHRRQ
mmetsp:Transcript_21423/g.48654  ORF Transcript_21423/g.48654 Transcript_21423/m.48654 type:complete len:362 (-) Transcript_21423:129-1214(-)